jgi:1-acyl-sn-glycerol-3-phosphate acyltransferase
MGLQNIEKTSVFYRLLYVSARFFFNLFYRRVIVVGKENIPKGKQIIFAANHQNALMDALAMLFAYGKPVIFLARADIFKKSLVAAVLYFLKMLPVFRPRDGAETMNQNYETFQHTARVLKAGLPIAILPEGTHSPLKKLQPLKKGICRMAFLTAESEQFKDEIMIVPVGIDYTNYSKAGTDLLLIYGKPIAVSEYYPLYQQNPQKAIVQLRDKLSKAIHNLMIDVRQDQYFRTYMKLDQMLESKNSLNGHEARIAQFYETQEFVGKLDAVVLEDPEWMPEVQKKTQTYFNALKKNGLREKLFQQKLPVAGNLIFLVLMSLILLPFHLGGMLFNYLPYKMPVIMARKVRDKQFLASLHYGYGFVMFLLWYILAAVAVYLISSSFMTMILVLLIAVFTGFISFYHYLHLLRLRGKLRLWILKKKRPAIVEQLINQREEILELLRQKSLLHPGTFSLRK